MSEDIRISVVIAAFRAEAFLMTAVQSALDQTRSPLEVIVVDDASPDATFSIAEGLARRDPRVRALRLEQNGGPAAARNHGISHSRGDWVAVLDADDTFELDRIEKITRFRHRSEKAMSILSLISWSGWAKTMSAYPDFHISDLKMPLALADFIARSRPYLPTPDFGLLKPVFRKAFLDDHAIRYPEAIRHGEDYILIVTALVAGARYHVLPFHGYRYANRTVGRSRTRIDYGRMQEFDAELRLWPEIRSDRAACEALEQRIIASRELEFENMPVYLKAAPRRGEACLLGFPALAQCLKITDQ